MKTTVPINSVKYAGLSYVIAGRRAVNGLLRALDNDPHYVVETPWRGPNAIDTLVWFMYGERG